MLFFGGGLLFGVQLVFRAGLAARSIDSIPFLGPAATVVPIGLLLFTVLRTLERIGSAEQESLLLTTVHPRAVVLGLVTAETARLAVWIGLPLAAIVVAFALGAGAPTLPLTVALVVAPLGCWVAIWGYAGGLALLRILRRIPTVHRALKIVGFAAMIALIVVSQFAGEFLVESDVALGALLDAITVPPLAAYVSLAFVGTSFASPVSPGALLVLVALLATTPIGLLVATRQASTLWFTDAPARETSTDASPSTGGAAAPAPFAWRKSGRLAWGQLVRAVRNPGELGHLIMIVFFLGPLGTTFLDSSGDTLAVLLAGTGVAIGTYLAGATFGLNPIGDDRPQFPLLLLTPTRPRTLVRGRLAAGLAVGLPVAVLLPVATMAMGTPPLHAVAFATTGVGTCLAGGLLAVGLGAAYPVYEEREFWGTETVVPSTLVMMGYVFVAVPGTVLWLIVAWYVPDGSFPPALATVVGLTVLLAVTVGPAYGSYRYACRRYRQYELD
jgi:hypothetical protein